MNVHLTTDIWYVEKWINFLNRKFEVLEKVSFLYFGIIDIYIYHLIKRLLILVIFNASIVQIFW